MYEQAIESCVHDPDILYRFRDVLPNNRGVERPKGELPDYGVCLVNLRPDGTVFHSKAPQRHTDDAQRE